VMTKCTDALFTDLFGDVAVTQLTIGLILFIGGHSIAIVMPRWRDAMVAKIGEFPWKGLYSLVSIAGLVLIVHGYAVARSEPTVLYLPPTWLRHVAFLLMAGVFPLLIASHIPGRIKDGIKHPTTFAVKIWAVAHLLTNGNLADVVLFGTFLAWAVAALISAKRRPRPPAPTLPRANFNDAVAIVVGLGLYVAFVLWLHPILIGMPLVG
jgi:uncharacterized membrane protein